MPDNDLIDGASRNDGVRTDTDRKNRDCIVAEATPPGRGGISIVRFSGEGCLSRLLSFVRVRGVDLVSDIKPRHTYLADVSVQGKRVDEAILVFFAGPASFTGEDVVELHLHGNPALVRLVIRESIEAGFRPATAGEFTQRAFLNGRLDLTQVDALGGMLAGERRELLEAAASQLGGSLRERLIDLRERTLTIVASLELGLDFVEEGYEFVEIETLAGTIAEIRDLVVELRRTYRTQADLGRLPTVALVGPPNAGKSTLFNAIVGFDRSITHDVPGTTRDYVSEVVDLGDLRFRVVDTAGLRETEEYVEAAGIERVAELVRDADVILSLMDGSLPENVPRATAQMDSLETSAEIIPVYTHADLEDFHVDQSSPFFPVSSIDRGSVNRLIEEIRRLLEESRASTEFPRFIVSERQEEVLARMEKILDAPILVDLTFHAAENLPSQSGDEIDTLLVAGELRRTLPLFGELVGEATNEDVLDRVFSQFCIGK